MRDGMLAYGVVGMWGHLASAGCGETFLCALIASGAGFDMTAAIIFSGGMARENEVAGKWRSSSSLAWPCGAGGAPCSLRRRRNGNNAGLMAAGRGEALKVEKISNCCRLMARPVARRCARYQAFGGGDGRTCRAWYLNIYFCWCLCALYRRAGMRRRGERHVCCEIIEALVIIVNKYHVGGVCIYASSDKQRAKW